MKTKLFAAATHAWAYTPWLVCLLFSACGSDHRSASTPATDGSASPSAATTFRSACQMPTSADTAPQSLLDTGCFAPSGAAAPAMYGYEVNGVLWADSAEKLRWLFVPPATPAAFAADGVLVLAGKAGVIKQFNRDGRRLETRFLFRNDKGAYEAVTYMWNDAGTDATLVPATGLTLTYGGDKTWSYFARSECLYCHNAPAGTLLGPRLPQLQRTVTTTAGAQVSQLNDMLAKGIVAPGFDAATVAWAQPSSDAPLALRARSYLATNCSFCHFPGGYSGTHVDLRYDTPLSQMGACDVPPSYGSFGVANAQILSPGAPNASILSLRMHSDLEGQKMPPVGHAVMDPIGTALIDAWITSLSGCTDN